MRQTTIVGMISLSLVAGCMASGTAPTIRPSPTILAPQTVPASPQASQDPLIGSTSPLPSASPSPGTAADWDQKLQEAFGPLDPAFAIGSPAPVPTSVSSPRDQDMLIAQ